MKKMTSKSENPEKGKITTRQIMASFYFAFSALFFISVFSSFLVYYAWSFIFPLVFLSVFTVFSVPTLIVALYSSPAVFYQRSVFIMMPMGLLYALVAYGLLKEKRAASVIAFVSSLLTILVGIDNIFRNSQSLNPAGLGLFVSGIIFNVLFLSLSPLGHKLKRR